MKKIIEAANNSAAVILPIVSETVAEAPSQALIDSFVDGVLAPTTVAPTATARLDKGAYIVVIDPIEGGWKVTARHKDTTPEQAMTTTAATTQKLCLDIKAKLGIKGQSQAQKEFDNCWRIEKATKVKK